MRQTEKKRLHKLLLVFAGLIAAGLTYALICAIFGIGIPCPIRSITGFKCPGCGVSRMAISLLRLDFASAWNANPVILLMVPFGVYIAVKMSISYVRFNKKTLSKVDSILVYIACAVLIIFGVLRNI